MLLHCAGVEPVQRVKKVVRARASRASGHAAGQQLVSGGQDTHMHVARAYYSCVVSTILYLQVNNSTIYNHSRYIY